MSQNQRSEAHQQQRLADASVERLFQNCLQKLGSWGDEPRDLGPKMYEALLAREVLFLLSGLDKGESMHPRTLALLVDGMTSRLVNHVQATFQ